MRKSLTILLALMFVFPGCVDEETDNLDNSDDSKINESGNDPLNETVNQTEEVSIWVRSLLMIAKALQITL